MRTGRLTGVVTCSMLTLAATLVSAQEVPKADTAAAEIGSPVHVGARVRLYGHRRKLTGRVLEVDDNRVLLQLHGDAAPVEMRRSEIRSVQVSRGVRPRTRTGAILGGITLGVPGAVAGAAAGSLYRCNFDCAEAYRGGLAGAVIFGGIGAGLGAAIGHAIRREEWESVKTPHFSASVAPVRGGLGGTFTVQF